MSDAMMGGAPTGMPSMMGTPPPAEDPQAQRYRMMMAQRLMNSGPGQSGAQPAAAQGDAGLMSALAAILGGATQGYNMGQGMPRAQAGFDTMGIMKGPG